MIGKAIKEAKRTLAKRKAKRPPRQHNIEPDLPHADAGADLHTAVSVGASLMFFGALAIIAEKKLHLNGDILFGMSSATFAPGAANWLRSWFPDY